jgi:HK97 family phage major capsid protein
MGGGDESISSAQDRVRAAEESERAQARANRVWARTSDGRTMTASGVSVGREGRTYSPHGEHSWIRDAIGVRIHGDYTGEARERLLQNSLELRDWAQQQERALSTTDGAGGEFVPPLWLVEQALEVARAGRVTADRVSNQDMPGGTDSINIPKVATGTAVAAQATQNTAVQNTDATTTSVRADVETIAGQQVVSLQAIEQFPANLDQLLLSDLLADLAVKVARL